MVDIYGTWRTRIDSGIFTVAQVRQFSSSAVRLHKGLSAGGAKSKLTADEATALVEHIGHNPVGINAVETAAGLDWLKKYAVRKLGESAGGRVFPIELVLEEFRDFRFHGRGIESTERYTVPLWEIRLRTGDAIDYYAVPWQQQSGDTGGWSQRWKKGSL